MRVRIRTIRRQAYPRSLLAVTTATVWLDGTPEMRTAMLDAAGHPGRRVTEDLVQVSRVLHREWTGARARGLPVPAWWRG